MNLCVVSTFDYTVADFIAMVEEFREDMLKVCSEWEIAKVNKHKTVTLVNVTDMDGFQELMTSPAVVEWDTANNTVDVIYSLEQMGE